jgi:pimeloyl-ACP methyl ester carboxylesterase
MADGELQALSRLAGSLAGDATRRIGDVHRAVAHRAWKVTGQAGAPSRVVHDVISAGVYTGVGHSLRLTGVAAGLALELAGDTAGWRAPSETHRGNAVLGVINGLLGDRLPGPHATLAIDMAVRRRGRDVALDTGALRDAFPDATGDVAVFVHGLVETDRSWRWAADRTYGDRRVTYGSRLRDDLGITPVYLRYNSGLRIGENGRLLDRLLVELVEHWPVPVERLLLVGHSMGGLVIRSACHHAVDHGHRWAGLVDHTVYLGTPHHGAPLARGAYRAGKALTRLPEVRPFGELLHDLSAGIDDLRHGSVVVKDWTGEDPDAWLDEDVALLDTCRHHVVCASVAKQAGSALDELVGDLLVQVTSANGRAERRKHLEFVAEEGLSLNGLNHFSLLNHPEIYVKLREWFTPARSPAGV